MGLGDRQDFDATRFRRETCLAVRRCVGLRCPVIALAPMGIAPDDVPRHAAALLSGIRAASEELAGAPDADAVERAREATEETLWIHLCLRRSEISGVQRALQEACREVDATEVELRAPEAERGPAMHSSRAGAPVRRQG